MWSTGSRFARLRSVAAALAAAAGLLTVASAGRPRPGAPANDRATGYGVDAPPGPPRSN